MPHYSFPTFPKFPTSPFPTAPTFDANGSIKFSFGESDIVLATGNGKLISTHGGNDFVASIGRDSTIDAGSGADTVVTIGDDAVVFGGAGKDLLLGGARDDSLWGGDGNDVIRTNGGNDYALGGKGNDLTDTGTGLGIHFGGAGNDTFSIGKEIFGNGAKDTIIALDFGNGADQLNVAPEILAKVASAVGGPVDLVPVLAAFEASGLGVTEVGQRLGLTDGGSAAFNEVATFLAQFQPNAQGQILVDATTVTTTEGDVIIALGVAPDDLLAAVA